MKVKIDSVNKQLRDNFDKRRKDQQKLAALQFKIQQEQEMMDLMPASKLSQAEINEKAQAL